MELNQDVNQQVKEDASDQTTGSSGTEHDEEVAITITVGEVIRILQLLAERPYKEVAPLIEKILYQANTQT
jgi:hypothetical protein